MKVSIVVPVFNEERLILDVLRRVAAVPVGKEIVVVDDCSKDGTQEILAALEKDPSPVTSADPSARTELRCYRQFVNRGKGAALHRGFAEAEGQVVVVQDADFEYDPSELPALIRPILEGEADVVYGSRFLHGYKGFPFWNTLANRLLTCLSNVVT